MTDKTNSTLPATMSAVVVHSFAQGLEGTRVEQRPVPQPASGDVLIRIAASVINPSDLMFIQGKYIKKLLPVIGGFEGAGTVVAVGADLVAEQWIGKRVHCLSAEGDGTWAAYMLTKAANCVPLDDSIDFEQGAMLVVNPLTAWALLDSVRSQNGTAVVQTAAASALGKMINRLGARWNIQVINVVRRPEQVAELRAMGAEHTLSSEDADFDQQLRELCHTAGAKRAFDAVGGELTGRVLQAMPSGSRITVFGGLSEQPCLIPVDQFIMRNKVVDGFWLSTWLPSQKRETIGRAFQEMQALSAGELQSTVRARYRLEDAAQAFQDYSQHMSAGKVLFTPE